MAFVWRNLVTLTLICAGIAPVADADPIAYVVTESRQFGTMDLATGTYSPIGATPDVLVGIGISNGTVYGVDTLDRLIAINTLFVVSIALLASVIARRRRP